MRTRVVSVVGLLSLGCAAATWGGAPAGTAVELIGNSLVPAAALALSAGGGWLLGHRGVRPWRLRATQAVAALNEAEAQLVRKEKLAMLGQLAGSVGHELRNPLGVMSNAVYYLDQLARLPLSPGVQVSRALPDADVTVRVDAVQVGQVLYNLLLNAVQAMDGGGGVLTVSARAEGVRVIVDVADTGPGIPPGFEQKTLTLPAADAEAAA